MSEDHVASVAFESLPLAVKRLVVALDHLHAVNERLATLCLTLQEEPPRESQQETAQAIESKSGTLTKLSEMSRTLLETIGETEQQLCLLETMLTDQEDKNDTAQ